MAVDVSTLNVKVVSDGIKETSQALDGLGTSAYIAEKKVVSLTESLSKLMAMQKNTATGQLNFSVSTGKASDGVAAATTRIEALLKKLQTQADLLGANNEKMAAYKAAALTSTQAQVELAASLGKQVDEFKKQTQATKEAEAAQKRLTSAQEAGRSLNLAGQRAAEMAAMRAQTQATQEAIKAQEKLAAAQAAGNLLNATGERQLQYKALAAAQAEAIRMNKAEDASKLALEKDHIAAIVMDKARAYRALATAQAEAIAMNKTIDAASASQAAKEASFISSLKLRAASIGKNNSELAILQATQAGYSAETIRLAGIHGASIDKIEGSTKSIKNHTGSMTDAHAAARGLTGSLGALWLTYGSVIPLAAGAAIGASFKQIVSIGKDVEGTLEGLRVKGQETVESVDKIRASVMALGQGIYGPKEVAKAFETMILAGLNAKQALTGISDALNLATVGGTTIEKSAYTLVQVGTALGYTAENYSRIADVIAMTAAVSMSSVETLSEAFKSGSVVGKLYGVTLVDIGTSLAALSNLGIQGSAAGTSLKNFYKELASSSDKVKNTLKDMKLVPEDFKDAEGRYLGVLQVVEKLAKGLNNLTEAQGRIAIANLSNERGMKTAIELLDLYKQKVDTTTEAGIQHGNMLQDIRTKIEESYGFAAIGAAQMSLTVEAQFKSVANTLQTVFLGAFQKISPEMNSVATSLKATFTSTEFIGTIQTLTVALAQFAVVLADNIPLIIKLVEAFLAAKALMFVVELFTSIRVAFLATSAAATTLGLTLGPITVALLAAGAAYAYFSRERDTSNLSTSQQVAIKYSEDYADALGKEAVRLNEQLVLMREGKTARDAETESMYKQQLAMARLQGDKAKLEAENRLEKAGMNVSMKDIEISNGIVKRGGVMTAAVKEFKDAQANLVAVNSKVDASFTRVAESQKAVMKAAKELEQERQKQEKENFKPSTGTGVLTPKVNKAAVNDQYNAALKEIQGRIDQEKRALKSLEAQYDSQYKQGIIGEIALINMKEAAEIKASKVELGLLEEKLRLSAPANKDAVRQDIANHKQKMADQEVESALRATQQIEEYYSKLQDNILKAEAQGYKERGQHVNAFLSEFGAKHEMESKHIASNIVQEQAKVTAALAAISSGNAGPDVMSQLANSTARLDILFKQTTTSAEAFAAGLQTNAVKEATESFDKLYLSLLNTLQGVKTSTEELGMGNMLEAAQKASDKYTASLKDLAAAQQAIATAGAGGSAVDTAKAEEALAKMSTLAEVQRKLWVGVGESISKSLKEAFGKGGQAAGEMLQAAIVADNMQQKIASERASSIAKLNADEYGYAEKVGKINIDAAKASSAASIKAYGNMASAAKGFFKEGTAGYKVLETAEKAFRVFEFAMQAKAVAMKLMDTETITSTVVAGKAIELSAMEAGSAAEAIHTAMSVEQAGAQSSAWGITAVVKAIASLPFPLNLAAGAATLAAVVAIGAKMAGGGGGSSVSLSEQRQKTQGTGTVLGDEGAKSESISKSIEILKNNSNIALSHSSKMLVALQSINDGISGMAASITQSSGLRGTTADQKGLGVGSSKSFLGFSSSSKELVDSGISFDQVQTKADEAAYKDALAKYTQERAAYDKTMEANFMGDAYHPGSYTGGPQAPSMMQTSSQTVGSVMANGVSAHGYADTHSESSSFWGLFSDSSDNTQLKELGSDLKLQFSKTVESMYKGVLSAAGALGKDSKLWEGVLKNVSFADAGLDKVSLKGLSGADIEKELQASFSKLGDTMAKAVMPELAVFQKVGEGMFQTLVRVASGVDSATFELEKMGIKAIDYTKILNKNGDVATEMARDSIMAVEGMSKVGEMMVDLSGNMGDLISAYTDLKTIRDQLFAGGLNGNNLSRDMVRGAGGLDALKTGSQSFFDNFLSGAEQQAAKVNALKVEFAAMNLTLPTTKDGYRALVKQLDNGTASGDKLVGKLISLSSAFSDVADGAKEIVLTGVDAAFEKLKRSVDAQKQTLNDIYDKHLKALQEQRDGASTSLKNIQSVFDMLNSALKTAQPLARGAAQEILRAALAFSNAGGSLVDYAGLDDALQAVAKPSEQMFSTLVDFQRDQQITANTIAALKANAKSQVSVAQMTLNAINASITTLDRNHLDDIAKLDGIIATAQAQVDAIHGVDNSVMSVEAAVAALATALTAAKSSVATPPVSSTSATATAASANAASISAGNTLLSDVSSYGKSYGGNGDAYYFIPGVNDYASKMESASAIAAITGMTAEQSIQLSSGHSSAYWADMQAQYDAGLHPTTASATIDGSHANGLDFVPKDGYRAELHKGERVQTAKQARDSDAVAGEIRQMREELNAALLAIAQNTGKSAKIAQKFDNDGLPTFRDLDGTGVVIDVNVVSTV